MPDVSSLPSFQHFIGRRAPARIDASAGKNGALPSLNTSVPTRDQIRKAQEVRLPKVGGWSSSAKAQGSFATSSSYDPNRSRSGAGRHAGRPSLKTFKTSQQPAFRQVVPAGDGDDLPNRTASGLSTSSILKLAFADSANAKDAEEKRHSKSDDLPKYVKSLMTHEYGNQFQVASSVESNDFDVKASANTRIIRKVQKKMNKIHHVIDDMKKEDPNYEEFVSCSGEKSTQLAQLRGLEVAATLSGGQNQSRILTRIGQNIKQAQHHLLGTGGR